MKRGFLNETARSGADDGKLIIDSRKLSLDDFEIIRLLGEGNFSKVYSAIIKATGEKVALKVLLLERVQRLHKTREILMEKHCLIKLNPWTYRDATRKSFDLDQVQLATSLVEMNDATAEHGAEHILKLFHTFKTDFELCFVTELCDGQELWDQIKGVGVLDLPSLRWLMSQILTSVGYMHAKRIVHRDIKAENIVLKLPGNLVRFVDFGTALDLDLPYEATLAGNASQPLHRKESGNSFRFFVGTPHFMAPEAQSNLSVTDCSSDIWSLGCLCYQLFAGSPPFSAASDFLQFARSTHLDLDIPCFMPREVEAFIRGCLIIDSRERPSIAELWESDLMKVCGGRCQCGDVCPSYSPLVALFLSLRTFYAKLMREAVLEAAPHLSPPAEDERQETRDESVQAETPATVAPQSDTDWLQSLFPGCGGRLVVSGSACERALAWFEALVLTPKRKAWLEVWTRFGKTAAESKTIDPAALETLRLLAVAEDSAAVVGVVCNSTEGAAVVMAFLHVAFDTVKTISSGPRGDDFYTDLAKKWLDHRNSREEKKSPK